MEDNVLITLRNLEDSLQKIDSARYMVTQTVGAYKEVQNQISVYSDALCTVSTNVKELVNFINNSHTELTTSTLDKLEISLNNTNKVASDISKIAERITVDFQRETEKVSNNFDRQITSFVVDMQESVDKRVGELTLKAGQLSAIAKQMETTITEQLKTVNGNLRTIESIGNSLNRSQEAQNKFLSDIIEKINQLGKEQEYALYKLSKDLKDSQALQDNELAELVQQLGNTTKKVGKLRYLLYVILAVCILLIIIVSIK